MEKEYPDFSKATSQQLLNILLAMTAVNPEDALEEAEREIPKLEDGQNPEEGRN